MYFVNCTNNKPPLELEPLTPPQHFSLFDYWRNPACTEASFVKSQANAFEATIIRLYEMEFDVPGGHLKRTSSHRSTSSSKSQPSQTVRGRSRKHAGYTSSSASSVAPSDKSLTSFPSFSPESPTIGKPSLHANGASRRASLRKASDPPPSTVHSLTATSPVLRNALFDYEPRRLSHVPGALHHVDDETIQRLIAKTGAVTLVRQIAEDLAHRDAQISSLRRKAEERERALRKIVLECGLSNLDLETRLRVIEGELRELEVERRCAGDSGLEDYLEDAMQDVVKSDERGDATIKPGGRSTIYPDNDSEMKGTGRGWKELLWGTSAKTSSRANSINADPRSATVVRSGAANGGRRSILQKDAFQPPEVGPLRSGSPSSSVQSSNQDRTPSSSFATLALRLVAGNPAAPRESEALCSGRGRASSTGEPASVRDPSGRDPSRASTRTTASARGVLTKPTPLNIQRRTTLGTAAIKRAQTPERPQERWDTMGTSPTSPSKSDNFGPVEMDTILDPETQPPTINQIYNNKNQTEFLTDRFGFIYDQRRKKRQKEAADVAKKAKRGSRVEMLSSARDLNSVYSEEDDSSMGRSMRSADSRPTTPTSLEEPTEDGNPVKRWQDYLTISNVKAELLSHTPSSAVPAFEVLEGTGAPKSPHIAPVERGFEPVANTTLAPAATISENATISKPVDPGNAALAKDDIEPVKLLLQQLGEVHDLSQREKTVRWNEFLRKVRAERKREGQAAVAARASGNEARSSRTMTIMPEVSLDDGELVGISGLGNKGKVGRAKWNEFKSLVLGGIPVVLRAKIWAEASGATSLRIPGYYDGLVARREGEDNPAIVAQIQMDINRTLTDNIFFRRGPGVAKLNEVLLAYSRRNPEVGYCQGMNLITGCLLLIMPTAEDAFWVLASIIEKILPHGYYDHSLIASRADQQVLRKYVASILPKLSAHLDSLHIELEALTFQWFLSIFTDCLSAEALFRVWDVVLCTNDGSTFLFQVALALLKLNEKQLLQCSTPAGVYTYINHQMTNHAISIDGLVGASEGLRREVRREEVEARRKGAVEEERLLMRKREERNEARRRERLARLEAEAEAEAEMKEGGTISDAVNPVKGAPADVGGTLAEEPLVLEDEEENPTKGGALSEAEAAAEDANGADSRVRTPTQIEEE